MLSGVPPLEADGSRRRHRRSATDADKAVAAQKMRGGSRKSMVELGAAATYATWYFGTVQGPVRYRRAHREHRPQDRHEAGQARGRKFHARYRGHKRLAR